jgi:hypothetical protein
MFWDEYAVDRHRKTQKTIIIERAVAFFILLISYFYGGISLAALFGIMIVVFLLSDIRQLLNYQNFMIEKQIGVHDLDS